MQFNVEMTQMKSAGRHIHEKKLQNDHHEKKKPWEFLDY